MSVADRSGSSRCRWDCHDQAHIDLEGLGCAVTSNNYDLGRIRVRYSGLSLNDGLGTVKEADLINRIEFPNTSQWCQANHVVGRIISEAIIDAFNQWLTIFVQYKRMARYGAVIDVRTTVTISQTTSIIKLDVEEVHGDVGQFDDRGFTVGVQASGVVILWIEQGHAWSHGVSSV